MSYRPKSARCIKTINFSIVEGTIGGPGLTAYTDETRRLYLQLDGGIVYRLEERDITRAMSDVVNTLGGIEVLNVGDNFG